MTFHSPETRPSLVLRLSNAADAAAWDEFVAVYGPLVFRLARRRGLQASDAEDLFQEVLASVAGSVDTWLCRQNRGKFRAWLQAIARNAAINHLTRPATRALAAGGDSGLAALEQVSSPAANAAEDFELEYRREVYRWAAVQVRGAVADSTWQAFQLTHVDGLSVNDAAQQLGTTAGNIYISRSRVMARLRHLVCRFEDET